MKRAIESSLRRGVEQLPQPNWEELADRQVIPMEAHDYITQQQLPASRRFGWARPMAALATLMLCMGLGWSYLFRQAVSVVDLDVNPSFELTANRQDQVLAVQGRNPAAAVLLEELSLDGRPLSQAVETLTRALADAGYLTGEHPTVLLSIHSSEEKREQRLGEALAQSIGAGAGPSLQPQVVCQSLKMESDLQQRAQEAGISIGRQQYIDRLREQHPTLDEEELLHRTVQELWELEQEDDADWMDDQDDRDDSDDESDETDHDEDLEDEWEDDEDDRTAPSQAYISPRPSDRDDDDDRDDQVQLEKDNEQEDADDESDEDKTDADDDDLEESDEDTDDEDD